MIEEVRLLLAALDDRDLLAIARADELDFAGALGQLL